MQFNRVLTGWADQNSESFTILTGHDFSECSKIKMAPNQKQKPSGKICQHFAEKDEIP